MQRSRLSRRRFLKTGAATAGLVAGAPYIKAGYSAGRLVLGVWDHWVPGANEVLERLCTDWGNANNVEVQVDFITSIGNKLLLTAQAETRAKTGHDIYSVPLWMPSLFSNSLEPMDDVMAEIVSRNGEPVPVVEHLTRFDDVWRAVPAPTGSLTFAQASRVDLFAEHAGIDLKAMFPADGSARDAALVDSWTYDAFLAAAGKLHAAGHQFGAPIAVTPDATQWLAMIFTGFGAVVIDGDGEIQVDSDETRMALEYLSQLVSYMPEGVYAWDDAGNNRWLISGTGSCIFNPPSAWAVAKRDNPDVAAQVWYHDTPKGPKGRFRSGAPFFWGAWNFSENMGAAKDLLLHMNSAEVVSEMLKASQGFDLPLYPKWYTTNDVWDQATPPDGVLHNYPILGDEVQMVPGIPAPPSMATQITTQGLFPNLVARVTQRGESMDDAISWAENELEGYLRR
ncbi:MAG: ABC transporter substrate-binding protein [Alphaproteobacteria bacterium]|jgi:hypothetical protein|nr:ABC transporter substrate-binding protein [Alphaproteobacteria bacterium]MDP6238013.1 ABC transporter substrate-binding protein [Alphaproteobacteria bacterium]MDP7173639.1 ABC transporter substrate-binding protein [Alphaproteobacteria bacterium]MDP7487148.1 ABC transporter substrate-binding protein [Alphaproteobacteria bacterium]|tara:strand:+ start:61 stop:1416 length:1356 start_codon:yes stop_codon:yes gene_type:complete